MTLRWVSVEARSGKIIADLPDLAQTSPLKLTLGRSETATANLPVSSDSPTDWQLATQPGYAALVALDDTLDIPLWGGLVTRRERTGDSGAPVAKLSLSTVEGYFDRRYVGNHTYAAQQQTAIVASLVLAHAGDALGLPFQYQTAASAILRDRTYSDLDDMTLYTALTNLMGVINGPEWTVSWMQLTSPVRYVPVLQTADRIGVSPPVGFGPAAEFSMGDMGSVITATTVEDYGRGAGANDVMAVSSSQNDARPQSPHQISADDGRLKFEYRWMPSSSIINVDVLTSHAQRALAILSPGTTTVSMIAQRVENEQRYAAPRLGKDWFLGDDAYFDLRHVMWPDGLNGTGRVVGWQLDDVTVAPILALPNLDPQEDS